MGTNEIVSAEGQSLEEYDIKKFYSEEQIKYYIRDLVKGRREFTEEVAKEGLKPEIIRAAERSFRIDTTEKKPLVSVPETPTKEIQKPSPLFPKTRPPREGFRRYYRS